jgi:hypothetical protein
MYGSLIANKVLGWLPIVGNVANAGITAPALNKVGWAAYKAFEEGKDIAELTSDDWKMYLRSVKKNKIHSNRLRD